MDGEIRDLARRLATQGRDIHDEADRLVGLAEACAWSGLAADALRRRTRWRAAALRRTAGKHEEAAQALVRHADEVEVRAELLASARRRAAALLGELVDLAAG